MGELALAIRAFKIPMRIGFRGVTERTGVLLEGPFGWGEFSPFPEYGPDVAAPWAAAALEAAQGSWPEPVRRTVPVNTTVPAVEADHAYRLVAGSGCSTAKVKVAEGDDEQRVAAVRDALGTSGKLRIDVNGRWSVDQATEAISRLARYDLEYVEQPVATLEEMAELRKRVDVPLAADESIRTAEDPLRVAGLEAADIVVLKVQPLGGVQRCLEIAERCGLPVVVSSALETSIGIAAGLALAGALPDLPYACGLGTVTMLDGDVVRDPLVPIDGTIDVRRPIVDEEVFAGSEIDGAEARFQITRLEEALSAWDAR